MLFTMYARSKLLLFRKALVRREQGLYSRPHLNLISSFWLCLSKVHFEGMGYSKVFNIGILWGRVSPFNPYLLL